MNRRKFRDGGKVKTTAKKTWTGLKEGEELIKNIEQKQKRMRDLVGSTNPPLSKPTRKKQSKK
jgi:hypothetical protein